MDRPLEASHQTIPQAGDDELRKEQVRLLLGNATSAALVNISVALITYLVIPTESWLWLALICLASALRAASSFVLPWRSPQPSQVNPLFFLAVGLITLQGASWGFASVQLFTSSQVLHRFYLIAIVCGVGGGAILFLAPSLLAFSCFVLATAGPLVALLLTQSEFTFRGAGFMGVVFLIAVHVAARRIHTATRDLLASRRELARLSTELATHKDRLEELVVERTAELEESRESYRRLAEEISDVIYEVGADGRFAYCSPAVTAVTGHRPEELLGRRFTEFIFPEDLPEVQRRFAALLQGELRASEYRVLDHQGRPHWIRSSSRPFAKADGTTGVRGVITDLGQIKKAAAEKAALLERIRDAQRLEAVGTLAGGIAHDFNNLLGAIMGFTDLALHQSAGDSPIRRHLERVMTATERARGLVQQILTFSRSAKNRSEVVSPQAIVQESLELLSASIPRTIEVRRHIAAQCWTIYADPGQVHQIVVNLCTNAYQAMRGKAGVLDISLDNVHVDLALSQTLPDLDPGEYVRLMVADTGYGIPDDVLPRIFDPFFTTKPVGEGSGMGLPVVHGIVHSLGGALAVATRAEEGTRFTVYLPRHEAANLPVRSEVPAQRLEGSERVLLVDDEELLVEMNREALAGLGYQVTGVASAVAALGVLEAAPEAFDVLVTDQTMPGLTGAQLAGKVRELRPDLPIIICTGYSDVLDRRHATELGIDRFLMKPVDIAGLTRAIREVVGEPRAPAFPPEPPKAAESVS